MKCSRCSASLTPIVAIDIDGTIADYHGHFLNFASEYLGYPIVPSYNGRQSFKEWFRNMTGEEPRVWNEIKLAYRQGAQKRTMPLIPGAKRLFSSAVKARAEIWLTTTRPYLRLDGIDADTRAWLERHGLQYHGLLYDEAKYDMLARNVDPRRVIAIIDDLPEEYDNALRNFGPDVPILMSTRWNQAVERDVMTSSLWTAGEMVLARSETWYAKYQNGDFHD